MLFLRSYKSPSHYSLALHFLLLFYFYISLSLPPPLQCFRIKTFTVPRLTLKYWWPFLSGPRHVKLHARARARTHTHAHTHTHTHTHREREAASEVALAVFWVLDGRHRLLTDLPIPHQFQMHRWENKKTITDSRKSSVNYVHMIPNTFTGQIRQ